MKLRRLLAPVIVAALLATITLAAASGASSRSHATHADKLKIALSNSFIGNKWRIEMENLFKAACKMPPYKQQVDCSVFNSGNDVSKQTQQISNLISQGVDAIVINAASPTGLNGIIGQACARGILVVSFDNIVTAPCALKVNTDQFEFGAAWRADLATKLHGKGNVIMVTGVAGTFVDSSATRARTRSSRSIRASRSSPATRACGTPRRRSGTPRRSCRLCPTSTASGSQGGTDGVAEGVHRRRARRSRSTAGEARERLPQVHPPQGYMGQHVTGISIGQPPFLVARLARARRAGAREAAREEERPASVPGRHREDRQVGARRSSRTCRTASSRTSPTPARRPRSRSASRRR